MGETQSGLSNADYAAWMTNTAAQACGDVKILYIKLTSGSETNYTQASQICEIMENATEEQVAGWQEVKFSGYDEDEEPWYAIDNRLDVNLERTVNFADVPINIRRPTGS